MGAALAKIVLTNGGPSALHCPSCGERIFNDDEYGGEELFCPHVLAVYDWSREMASGLRIDENLRAFFNDIGNNAGVHAEVAKAMAEKLQENDLVLHLNEPSQGAGHDGTDFVVAFRFPMESDLTVE